MFVTNPTKRDLPQIIGGNARYAYTLDVKNPYFYLFGACLIVRTIDNVIFVLCKGGAIVLKEVNGHWSDNLIPSPSKKDVVFQHIKGPGLHSFVEQANGVVKYLCAPEA